MDALRFSSSSKSLRLEHVDKPRLASEDEVIVEVKCAGVCGTDLHIIAGNFGELSERPVTLGHELSGVVVEAGKVAANKFPVGSRVGVDPNRGCHRCSFCLRGDVHHCDTAGVHEAIGHFNDGGFAKFCRVNMAQLATLSDEVDFVQGALCEPLSCVLHGWDRLQRMRPLSADCRVVILGAGIIGNLWAAILHHNGHRHVVISEPSQHRRELANRLDTGYSVVSPSELSSVLPTGADVIIDTTGAPAALQASLALTRKGAAVCVFGCAPPGKTIELSPEEMFRKELIVFGSFINPFTYCRAVALASAMGSRYLDANKLGIEFFDLKDFEKALDKLRAGQIAKAMFKY